MTFGELWPLIDSIKGWLSRDEAEFLFDLSQPCQGPIVEIGSYNGRSTVLLASSGRPVYAIDPLQPGYKGIVTEADVGNFKNRILQYPNITWLRSTAAECSAPPAPVGLVFIDGNHEYPFPLRDFKTVLPWCRPDAVFAFHDYLAHAGVTQSIVEIITGGAFEFLNRVNSVYALTRRL